MERILAAALILGLVPAVAVAEQMDLELVLAADASGSIDDGEIRLQRQGYAAALTSGDILEAIGVGYLGRIAVTYVEWGDQNSQVTVVPWRVIDGPESARAFADELMAQPRLAFGRNAIGSVIDFAQREIETNAHQGERLVIDVSADSAYSWGGVPLALARDRAIEAGITINGLAVLCRSCSGRPMGGDLEGEFARRIIGGPASFVVTADGNTSFVEAVRKKLLLEIAGLESGAVMAAGHDGGRPVAAVRRHFPVRYRTRAGDCGDRCRRSPALSRIAAARSCGTCLPAL
jgi:hypothetical protein